MKKIAFVINPNSGVSDKKQVIAFLHDKFINSQELFVEFYYTKGKGDATIAAQKFSENNFDVVVAVGGDGTVNETSRGLLNSKTSLAIIPSGSGNGLARHLKIPLSYKKASELILTGKDISIDVGKINDEYFFVLRV
jgi:Sphingosine kinase and enzymes related to eukaryotic diacylglycerol kinase